MRVSASVCLFVYRWSKGAAANEVSLWVPVCLFACMCVCLSMWKVSMSNETATGKQVYNCMKYKISGFSVHIRTKFSCYRRQAVQFKVSRFAKR